MTSHGSANKTTGGEQPVPLLPRPGNASDDAEALRSLRRFHLDPAAVDPEAEPPATGEQLPLPALLAPLADVERVRTDEPFVALPAEDGDSRLHLLPDWLRHWLPRSEAPMLAELAPHLERRLRRALADGGPPRPARPLLAEALDGLGEELELAEEGRQRLTAEAEAALARLPEGARLVPLGPGTARALLLLLMGNRRPATREALAAEVAHAVEGLGALLGDEGVEEDRSGDAAAADEGRTGDAGEDRLSAQLGAAGRYLDSSALASRLGSRRRPRALEADATATLERDRDLLRAFPREAEARGGVTLVTAAGEHGADGSPAEAETPAGTALEILEAPAGEDPFARAGGCWDRAADRLAGVLRALRRAGLAVAGDWRPERHDPWLERLDRRALTPRERALVPPVVVTVDAATAGRHLASLTRLLLSDRPVQVLVTVDPADPAAVDPEGHRFELGLYGLALEHPFVQQGSAARPLALAEGFRRALDGERPALHLVAEHGEDVRGGVFWRAAGAALESRAHPLFLWNPAAGSGWAERFSLEGNPRPEADWSTGEIPYRRPEGRQETLETAFTFADFALLAPSLAGHFRPVPEGVPEGELLPVAQALEVAEDELRRLPFLWAVSGAGAGSADELRLERWVISRPLLRACRDRRDAWHDLQERAGVSSSHVRAARRAVEQSWEERWAEERQRLEQDHARELAQVRRRAAEEAVDRLATALLAGPLMEASPAAPVAPAASSTAPPRAPLSGSADGGGGNGAAAAMGIEGGVEPAVEQVEALTERLLARLGETESPESPETLSAQAQALADRLLSRLGEGTPGSA